MFDYLWCSLSKVYNGCRSEVTTVCSVDMKIFKKNYQYWLHICVKYYSVCMHSMGILYMYISIQFIDVADMFGICNMHKQSRYFAMKTKHYHCHRFAWRCWHRCYPCEDVFRFCMKSKKPYSLALVCFMLNSSTFVSTEQTSERKSRVRACKSLVLDQARPHQINSIHSKQFGICECAPVSFRSIFPGSCIHFVLEYKSLSGYAQLPILQTL